MARTSSTTTAPASPATGDVPADLTERLGALRDALLTGLVERDVAIRLALIATLAGEHLLLVGPPGTAKSLIARRLRLALRGSVFFERLLTRFTVPEELFGPLSIKGLEEDRYERQTAGYLPTASVAFLDEIFKANSAILNALLTLLNEREFDNGTRRERTPLLAVIGASNELGDADELAALYDRFLLRLHVGPVSRAGFARLLDLRGESVPEVSESLRLSREDLAAVQAAALGVEVPGDVTALLADLRDWCTAQEIQVSDRRWRKVVKLLQVSALTNGRREVSIWDCWLLQHCLWDQPEDREKIYGWYAERVGASRAMDPSQLARIVTVLEARLKADQEKREQMRDDEGCPLFLGKDGSTTTDEKRPEQRTRGGERLFLAPQQAWTGYYCYDNEKVSGRVNGGKGYTLVELGELFVSQTVQFKSWRDRAEYLSDSNNGYMQTSTFPPAMEPARHSPAHVAWFSGEVATHRAKVVEYRALVARRIGALEVEIGSHLWLLPEFAEPARRSLAETAWRVEALLERLDTVARGIERLPVEDSFVLPEEHGEQQPAEA